MEEEIKEEVGMCDSHEDVPPAPQSLRTRGSGRAGAATGVRHREQGDMPVVRGGTAHCAAGVPGVQVHWEGAGFDHTPRAARAAIWAEPVRGRHGRAEAAVSGGTATVSPRRVGDEERGKVH